MGSATPPTACYTCTEWVYPSSEHLPRRKGIISPRGAQRTQLGSSNNNCNCNWTIKCCPVGLAMWSNCQAELSCAIAPGVLPALAPVQTRSCTWIVRRYRLPVPACACPPAPPSICIWKQAGQQAGAGSTLIIRLFLIESPSASPSRGQTSLPVCLCLSGRSVQLGASVQRAQVSPAPGWDFAACVLKCLWPLQMHLLHHLSGVAAARWQGGNRWQ